jgi:Phasin protein
MAQKGTSVERSVKPAIPGVLHVELAEIGKKGFDAIIHMQRELCDALGEMNRDWFARAQAEANLASEFATRLTTARSVPDTAIMCQEWMGRRMEMFAENSRRFVADSRRFVEDSRRFLADSQKFMEASARFLSGGFGGRSTEH